MIVRTVAAIFCDHDDRDDHIETRLNSTGDPKLVLCTSFKLNYSKAWVSGTRGNEMENTQICRESSSIPYGE